MSVERLNSELDRGGKFVIFPYCISVLVASFRGASDIYFIRAGESTFSKASVYALISLLFGWWGIPWGPIYTIGSLITNLKGGKDITHELVDSVERQEHEETEVR